MMCVDKGADMQYESPFLIKRSLIEILDRMECKKLRTGTLLIKFSQEQAEKLSEMKQLNKEYNVSFNTSKRKIFSRDFRYLSDEEVLSELYDQKISDVRMIKKSDKESNKLTLGWENHDFRKGLILLRPHTAPPRDTLSYIWKLKHMINSSCNFLVSKSCFSIKIKKYKI